MSELSITSEQNLLGALVSPKQLANLENSLAVGNMNNDDCDSEEEHLHEPSNFKIKPINVKERRVTIADDLPSFKNVTPAAIEGRSYRRSRYSTFIAGINQFDPYQELTGTQIAAFRQVFDMVDHDGGGSIDAEELYTSMKDLESGLNLGEIKEILDELDRDGNGEIDFEEFLYMMTSMSLQIKEAQEDSVLFKQGKRRQSIFFSVITKFAMKHSLKEIERYYASKAKRSPHVVGHYAAGARVFGLTDKELRKTWKQLSHASKGKDSPYAQPLNFIVDYDNGTCKKKTISPLCQKKVRKSPSPTPTPTPQPKPIYKFKLKAKASKSDDAANNDSNTNAQNNAQINTRRMSNSASGNSSRRASLNSNNGTRKLSISADNITSLNTLEESSTSCRINFTSITPEKVDGWTPRHRLPATKVKLPKVTYSQHKRLTIKDMDKIRQRVNDARNRYYNHLSEEKVSKAREYWKCLKTEQIPSERLQTNFKKVFRCYSPTNDKERRTPSPTRRAKSPEDSIDTYKMVDEYPDFVF